MRVGDLYEMGFFHRDGNYATSKWIVKDDRWGENSSATIQYRPGNGIVLNSGDDVDFSRFSLCIYGNSSCPSIPVKIRSKEDLIQLERFF